MTHFKVIRGHDAFQGHSRSWRISRSFEVMTHFKVIRGHDAFQGHSRSFWYQSKPVSCRMRLASSEYILSRTFCKISCTIDQIIAFDRRCLPLTNSFSVTSANVAVSDISLRTRLFGLHFCGKHCKSIFNHFDVIGLQIYRIRLK